MKGRFAQLALALPPRTALGRSDFLISPGNHDAIAWLDRWPDWPGGGLALHGPAGCGKSHLLALWRAASAGTILAPASVEAAAQAGAEWPARPAFAVDDADRAPAAALLHLYNRCREAGGSVLLAARTPPAAWPLALADLASRLRALVAVAIGVPDEALLGALLVKHCADRQLPVAPEVVSYIVTRMERSFAAAAAIVARLDALALGGHARVTVPLARLALADEDAQSSEPGVT